MKKKLTSVDIYDYNYTFYIDYKIFLSGQIDTCINKYVLFNRYNSQNSVAISTRHSLFSVQSATGQFICNNIEQNFKFSVQWH